MALVYSKTFENSVNHGQELGETQDFIPESFNSNDRVLPE
jgi:hypothetical protein